MGFGINDLESKIIKRHFQKYPQEYIDFIQELAEKYLRYVEIAEQINAVYGTDFTGRMIRDVCLYRGIKNKYRQNVTGITNEQVIFATSLVNEKVTWDSITNKVNERFGTNHTVKKLQRFLWRRGVTNGRKLHLDIPNPVRYKQEQVTTVRQIKIDSVKQKTQRENRLMYEKIYGVKLQRTDMVVFKDGDINNNSKDNLVLLTIGATKYLKKYRELQTQDNVDTIILLSKIKAKANQVNLKGE